MRNKKIIKSVFEKEFNEKEIYKTILIKAKRKDNNKNFVFKVALSTCIIVLLLASAYLKESNAPKLLRGENYSTSSSGNDELNINNIDASTSSAKRIDGKIKSFDVSKSEKWIKDLKFKIDIPNDLNELDCYKIYLRKDVKSEYDILKDYVFDYSNKKQDKNIRIVFSKTSNPLRDYSFDTTADKSYFNGIELVIYQYDDSYYVNFYDNGLYYDIETNNVAIEEVKSLLKSIIG